MTTSIKVFIRGSKTPNKLIISIPIEKTITNNLIDSLEKSLTNPVLELLIALDINGNFHRLFLIHFNMRLPTKKRVVHSQEVNTKKRLSL